MQGSGLEARRVCGISNPCKTSVPRPSSLVFLSAGSEGIGEPPPRTVAIRIHLGKENRHRAALFSPEGGHAVKSTLLAA